MRKLSTLGGSFLVAGTAIGAGMLALPVMTGLGGFFPSLVILFLSWAFMVSTGIYFAELSCFYKKNVNVLTMASMTLGKVGIAVAWAVYLFFFNALLVAYLVGGGNILSDFGIFNLSSITYIALFGIIFVSIVACGKRIVDSINTFCMLLLLLAYACFILVGAKFIDSNNLSYINWSYAPFSLPIAFAAFGYQGTVPTISSWMGYDVGKVRKSIIYGSLITLVVYILWELLLLGIVPVEGDHGLLMITKEGRDAIHPLQFFTKNDWVWIIGKIFAFFAITTSFLGVGIGLVDFWADGLKVKKDGIGVKILLLALSFLPPLTISLTHPTVFLKALGLAGGFGSAILLGILPIAMIYSAKFYRKDDLLRSGVLSTKGALVALTSFATFEIICELISLVS